MKKKQWRVRSGKRVATKATLPGVWALADGGWWVRGAAKDPRNGRLREISAFLDEVEEAHEALAWLRSEQSRIRRIVADDDKPSRIRFAEFAASLFQRKVEVGEIQSAASRERWANTLEHHLLPVFGEYLVDSITFSDLEDWRHHCGRLVDTGEYAVTTVNGWISVLKVICKAAKKQFRLSDNPAEDLDPLPTRGHRIYTTDAPNALQPADVTRFLECMGQVYPQHYAMSVLGFTTGLRPSHMRPLRRKGAQSDVVWDAGYLHVRRSNSRGAEVMSSTKTDIDQRIALPKKLMDVLRAHVAMLPDGPMLDSALLFPSATGGFRSRSVLDKPFARVCREIDLPYRFTPRGMRRTFQDLARAASLLDVVTRSISGHLTEAMHHHYSTVGTDEQRSALQKIVDTAFSGSDHG